MSRYLLVVLFSVNEGPEKEGEIKQKRGREREEWREKGSYKITTRRLRGSNVCGFMECPQIDFEGKILIEDEPLRMPFTTAHE